MRIAIVTGASSGMGREFALQLPAWEHFDEIWVIARRAERLTELQQYLTVPVRPISLDLTDNMALEHFSDMLSAAQAEVGLLANIAGFGKFGRYDEIPLEDSMKMIDLNCKAVVSLCTMTLPFMKRGAKIVNLDSLSAFQPVPYINVYGASKAFILSYSRALNRELKPRGIRVMSVNPFWVKTEFFEHALKTSNTAITHYSRWYEAKDVIATALKHLYKSKKDVSIHGFYARWQVRLTKLLPHSLVMNVWLRQQKKHKLPEE